MTSEIWPFDSIKSLPRNGRFCFSVGSYMVNTVSSCYIHRSKSIIRLVITISWTIISLVPLGILCYLLFVMLMDRRLLTQITEVWYRKSTNHWGVEIAIINIKLSEWIFWINIWCITFFFQVDYFPKVKQNLYKIFEIVVFNFFFNCEKSW